jgi:hypothetical protein
VATFTCKVNLYDEYKVTAIVKWEPLLCYAEFVDTSSFVARVFSKAVEIHSVKNSRPKQNKPAACSQFQYITDGCIGPAHINGNLVTGYKCSNDYPAKINFEFRSVEVTFLKAIVRVGTVVSPPQDENGNSWPGKIYLIANGNSQISGITSGKLIYKLIIDPIRN